ncbi:DUF5071 domain-containing protein [Paenibacillus sp. F6_3S_P_1C]|uniref:DUF5071 domain-containing protein n=1 Tax=Paenibacillus vandeheii TaxID=3035917 RepID=A0ABT8J6E8_9BACL|nr:DUF5071 domain-containing protein [Paenibacillus vandeheii]MDN4600636.1 DUF5071 domain-containing protein [Paenibacillus vandeheii]
MRNIKNIRELLPRDKHDLERVEQLKTESLENLRLILPELLEWLQDGNWPISDPIEDILINFQYELIPYIREILDTNDVGWKYFLLDGLVRKLPDNILRELEQDLRRIINRPTKDEKTEEVDEIAREILERL